MQRFTIVDGHEDIAFNALSLRRNFLDKISNIRTKNAFKSEGIPTVSFPELKKGNVRIVFATIWVAPCQKSPVPRGLCYSASDEAHALAMAQMDYYRSIESQGYVNIIRTKAELKEHLSCKTKVGLVILMEGADPILAPKEAKEWFRAGVRIIGPAWQRTKYSGGTGAPGPLTKEGKELMAEMETAGMILDMSHMADESFFDALDLFHGNVIASHSNCRKYVPTDRQLTDEMIKALVSKNGVIGTVLFNKFLDPDWKRKGKAKKEVTFSAVIKHMKNVCDLSGDTLHSAIGSDLDGGFGAESVPRGIDTVADLQKLGDALGNEGFSVIEVSNIMADNWIRLLKRALPE
ncbi:MAG TPA: membrane dipeptidase [Candidatus Bathyarchaeia archaeon]|nr:membrane dipeptidase [Candidatus Bathyarchaeia archaeon]